MSSSSSSSSGVGTAGLLGVAFVVLKLVGVIDWSWWWVTAPFWMGLALLLAILLGITIFAAIGAAGVAAISSILDRRRERRRAILRAKVDKELRDAQNRNRNVR